MFLLKSKYTNNLLKKLFLFSLLLLVFGEGWGQLKPTVTFNELYISTANGYNGSSNSITITNSLIGRNFRFVGDLIGTNGAFVASGNDVSGVLRYITPNKNDTSISGVISRKYTGGGSTTKGFYFWLTNGYAYLFMNPTYDADVNGNGSFQTNSSGFLTDLETFRTSQVLININNNISNFETCLNTSSTSQSFSISASKLTSNVTISAPTNFEISSTLSGTYTNTLSLSKDGSNNLATSNIYVRLKSNSVSGAYSGNILVSSTNAADQELFLSGDVYPTTAISSSPISSTVCEGTQTSFSVSSVGAKLTYQWQVSTDGGTVWNNITNSSTDIYLGENANTLILSTALTSSYNGYKYKCIVTGSCSSATSGSATLTVNSKPQITSQPNNLTVCTGTTSSFTVTATGTTLAYQWQVLTTSGGATWTNVTNLGAYSGATTSTLLITNPNATYNNYQYRCIVSGSCSPSATSNIATLSINDIPTVPGTITGLDHICKNNYQVYSIASATGATSYSWGLPSGWTGTSSSTYINIISSTNSGTISVTASNSCGTSSASTLLVDVSDLPAPTPAFTINNATQCLSGNSFSFTNASTAAAGSTISSTFWDFGDTYTASTTNSTHSYASANTFNAIIKITATNNCVSSLSKTVIVNPAPTAVISGSNSICSGSSSNLTVNLTGTAPWTLIYSGSTNPIVINSSPYTFAVSPSATTSYTLTSLNDANCSAVSANLTGSATITVTSNNSASVSLLSNATNNSICSTNTVTFTATPTNGGSAPSYQWLINGSITLTTSSNTYSTTTLADNDQVSVIMTSNLATCLVGSPAQSNIITTEVHPSYPATPASISGTQQQCASLTDQAYSITDVLNASSYTWSVPTGWTITSGQGTTSVKVTTGAANQNGDITVTASNGCGTSSAQILAGTVTNTSNTITLVSAGTDSQSACYNTSITNIRYSTSGTLTSASFSGLPTGITGSIAVGVITITGSTTSTGKFDYVVTLTGGSCNDNASGSITINPLNTLTLSSAAGTDSQTLCVSSPLSIITYTTTGATSATVSGLPSGVTGNFNLANNLVTISGTPTAAGIFNYTVTLSGGCGTITKTGVISVTAANTYSLTSGAGSNNQSKCVNTAITNITYSTTGATGISVIGIPSGVSVSFASNIITISGTPTVSGTFNYTITLTGGCSNLSITGTLTISAPLESPTISGSTTYCAGSNTILTASTAGVGGSYLWSTGATTQNLTVTSAGSYSVTITNASGCSATSAATSITEIPAPTKPTASLTDPTCDIATGSISVTSTTAGLTFSLANGSGTVTNTSGSFTGLSAGNYSLTATNTTGCVSGVLTKTIASQPLTPSINITSVPGITNVENSFEILFNDIRNSPNSYTLTSTGSNAYSGTFSNSGIFSTSPLSIGISGTYTGTFDFNLTVSNTSCSSSTYSFTLNVTTIDAGHISFFDGSTYFYEQTICEDQNLPITTISNKLDATAGSTYQWQSSIDLSPLNESAYTNILTNSTSSTYTITTGSITQTTHYRRVATKGSDVAKSNVVTVDIITLPTKPTASIIDPTCTVSTGTISVTSTTAGLTFSLANGSGTVTNTTGSFTGLLAGTYSLTATNSTGCVSGVLTKTIATQPLPPSQPTASIIDPTCTVSTGTISVTSTSAGLTFSLANGSGTVTNTSGSFTGLSAGTYSLTATNATGCVSGVLTKTIAAQPLPPSQPTASIIDPTCDIATGTISVTSTTAGLTFSLANGSGTVTNTTGSFTGLSAGTYSLTATNATGCVSGVLTKTIASQPLPPSQPTASIIDPTCTVSTGTISVTSTSASLTFSLANGSGTVTNTTGVFNTVASGSYSLTAQNSNSCVSSITPIVVNVQPITPSASIGTIAQINTTATSFEIPYTVTGTPSQYSIVAGTPAMTGFSTINYTTLAASPLTISIPASAANTYGFTISFKTADGCSVSKDLNLTVVNSSLGASTITATGTITYTYNGSAQGPGTSTVTGSTGAVTYSYSGTGSTTYSTSAILPTEVGTYQVIASVAGDANYSGASSLAYTFTISKASSTIVASGTRTYTYNGSAQGPGTSTVTGSTGAVTYSYSGTGSTTYVTSASLPTNVGTYKVIANVAPDGSYNGASSSEYNFTITEALVLIPQASLSLIYPSLLSSDSVRIKINIQDGKSPYSVYISNVSNNKKYVYNNIVSDQILKLPPVGQNVTYKLDKVIDAISETRTSGFTKDTANLKILYPKIALTLTAEPPIQEPDKSFKLKLIMKIKNEGQLDLNDVQVDANLSSVFPKGMVYKLDSVKVISGNLVLNPNYNGIGTTIRSTSSNTFSSSSATKVANAIPGNYLFSNGIQLPINYGGQVNFYFSIAQTNITTPLILQFNTSGKGILNQSDYSASSEATTAFSHDATNPDLHPGVVEVGEPTPTYVPLFPNYTIGAALNASNAEIVNGGYVFHMEAKVKNYSNMNIDSLRIVHDFSKMFPVPDSAFLIGKPTINDHLVFNNSFNGYSNTSLVTQAGLMTIGDSVVIKYDVLVKTQKIKYTWLNYIEAYAHSTIGDSILYDQSTFGLEPDPNGDEITIEKEYTRCYINYTIPEPPLVENMTYLYNSKSTPSTIRPLVKSYPIGSVPTWCNLITSVCDTVAPVTPKEIGKYIFALKSYDTTSLLYSQNYTYDTIIIKPTTPLVKDSTYILGLVSNPKNVEVQFSLLPNAKPKYYIQNNSNIPNLPVIPGTFRYCISQVVNDIESDTVSFIVNTLDVNNVIHLQKIIDSSIITTNSTFDYQIKLITHNLTKYDFKNIELIDNVKNQIPSGIALETSVDKTSSSFEINSLFNGDNISTLTNKTSNLKANSTDTLKFKINIKPNGFSGDLYNQAYINVKTIWGDILLNSSPNDLNNRLSKVPTKYIVPNLSINIPEGFSPNFDGVNDYFIIIKPSNIKISIEVVNRWGNLVYSNNDYKNDWDGRGSYSFIGQDLADGGYYYNIIATDQSNNKQNFKGFIIIQR